MGDEIEAAEIMTREKFDREVCELGHHHEVMRLVTACGTELTADYHQATGTLQLRCAHCDKVTMTVQVAWGTH